MKNKNKVKVSHPVPTPPAEANATASTHVAPAAPAQIAVLPKEYESHDPSLKPATLSLAVIVGQKNPAIVEAAVAFRQVFAEAGTKYLNLATALRTAKLPKKEGTALLRALGLTKGRASELLSLSAVSDEVWAKYTANTIGFRAALQLENGPSKENPAEVPPGEHPAESGGEDSGEEGPQPTKKLVFHELPQSVKDAINDAVAIWANPVKNKKPTDYAFVLVSGKTAFTVNITAALNK